MTSDSTAKLKGGSAREYFMSRRFTTDNSLAWIAGAISAALATSGGLLFALRRQVDFSVYLNGAEHLFSNRLYQVRLSPGPHLHFTYPPFAALVFDPLTFVPATVAQALWTLVNLAALYAILYLPLRAVASAAPTVGDGGADAAAGASYDHHALFPGRRVHLNHPPLFSLFQGKTANRAQRDDSCRPDGTLITLLYFRLIVGALGSGRALRAAAYEGRADRGPEATRDGPSTSSLRAGRQA